MRAVFSLISILLAATWLSSAASGETIEVKSLNGTSKNLTIAPLSSTVDFQFRAVPSFSMTYVALDDGGNPGLTLYASGEIQATDKGPFWQWNVEKVDIANSAVRGTLPMATVLMLTDDGGIAQRSRATFPAYFEAGASNLNPEDPGYLATTWLVAGLSHGFISLPAGGVRPNGEAADPNIYLPGLLAALAPEASITAPLPKTKALGLVEYDGKQALVSETSGSVTMEIFPNAMTLNITGVALIDLDTALPIYTDHRIEVQLNPADGDSPPAGAFRVRTYMDY